MRQIGSQGNATTDHPLPVAQALGVDRLRRFAVEHGDDVGHRRQYAVAVQGDQVLVLDLEHDGAAAVPVQTLDLGAAADEPARHAALDVGQLAGDQDARRRRVALSASTGSSAAAIASADADGAGVTESAHGRRAGLRGGHRVLGRARAPAELDRQGARDPLHPGAVGGA